MLCGHTFSLVQIPCVEWKLIQIIFSKFCYFIKPLEFLLLCRIKIPYPLQWGAPTFDAGHAFGMMAAVLVSLIEVVLLPQNKGSISNFTSTDACINVYLFQSTGAYKAASRLASATPPPAHVLSRGIGWQVCKVQTFNDD